MRQTAASMGHATLSQNVHHWGEQLQEHVLSPLECVVSSALDAEDNHQPTTPTPSCPPTPRPLIQTHAHTPSVSSALTLVK